MAMKDRCPDCGARLEQDMNDWAYKKYNRQACPVCGWKSKERMPHNYWARRVA